MGFGVGRGQKHRFAALRDHAALNDAIDIIAVLFGLRKRLQQRRCHPLANQIAVRIFIKRANPLLVGQKPHFAVGNMRKSILHDGDATDQRILDFAPQQRVVSQMQCAGRRGAGRVHRQAVAFPIKKI